MEGNMATGLEKWVEEQAKVCKPDKIYWCDGSEEEARRLIEIGINEEKVNGQAIFHRLNQSWPNGYYHRSHPTDVARTEHLTFVCHPDKETAGPNNNWMSPEEAKEKMRKLSDGCMKGRTMYVLPYTMRHPDSPYAKSCIQLTDISYVAVSMRVMTRMSKKAIDRIGKSDDFVKGLHSIGDLDPNKRFIMHFPDEHFVWTLGDDIAWLNVGTDGRLWAINPETGLFGVAPGTSMKTNPNMLKTLKGTRFAPTLFTNTGLNPRTNEPWWEGLDGDAPKNLIDWQGKPWQSGQESKAAHPNARFTASIYNSPTLSREFDNPKGVPISAIILGGRRSRLIPLVTEAFNWQNGVFLGARTGLETTAAAAHQVGVLRRDPMAMLPFCGYNMGDYFRNWLDIGKNLKHPPKIYSVNWFRADENGRFIWPGFGENIRVLKWILERVYGRAEAQETPLGLIPCPRDL